MLKEQSTETRVKETLHRKARAKETVNWLDYERVLSYHMWINFKSIPSLPSLVSSRVYPSSFARVKTMVLQRQLLTLVKNQISSVHLSLLVNAKQPLRITLLSVCPPSLQQHLICVFVFPKSVHSRWMRVKLKNYVIRVFCWSNSFVNRRFAENFNQNLTLAQQNWNS